MNPEQLIARGQRDGVANGQPCQAWVNALPKELRIEPLRVLKFEGDLYWHVDLSAKGTDGKPKPAIDISLCQVYRPSCEDLGLHHNFAYSVYSAEGELMDKSSGPGTMGWVPLGQAGTMPTAVINNEDYYFYHHSAFVPYALYAAAEADLKRPGQFVRGGSTITMQLAKNLWLRRDKTRIGRKAQELFLAMALESCFSSQIMELYLNVVEFGPNIYGVGKEAGFWFGTSPAALTPVQAFWLGGILTNPRKAGHPTPDALARTEKLMRKLAGMGRDVGPLARPQRRTKAVKFTDEEIEHAATRAYELAAREELLGRSGQSYDVLAEILEFLYNERATALETLSQRTESCNKCIERQDKYESFLDDFDRMRKALRSRLDMRECQTVITPEDQRYKILERALGATIFLFQVTSKKPSNTRICCPGRYRAQGARSA